MIDADRQPGLEPFRRRRQPDTEARRPFEERSFAPREDRSAFAFRGFDERPALEDRAFAVIPCLNEAQHIEGLIRHLLTDPSWRDPLVVVADGGSTDGTVEIVRAMAAEDLRIRLVDNPRRLQSAGVNLAAARHGRGRRWMVRVDAHAGYPEAYVSRLIEEARRTGAASVVVAMDTVGRGGFQSMAAAAQNSVLGTGGSAHRSKGASGWVDHGHHALFDLEHFFAAGGYDETFRANEDAEFDVRLGQEGGKIWLSDGVRVTYYPRSTARGLFGQYLNYGRGRARTLLRHRQRPKLRQMLPVAVAPAAMLAPFGLFDRFLFLPAVAWAGGCLGVGVLLGLKKNNRAAIASGVAAAVMHLAWSIGFWQQLLSSAKDRSPKPALAQEALAEDRAAP
jgi:succinoglycan biosynthesis protein ExoA